MGLIKNKTNDKISLVATVNCEQLVCVSCVQLNKGQ